MVASEVIPGGRVPFAPFTGEKIYMRRFNPGESLPVDLARWQATVDAMLDGVKSHGPAYLMVDQALVRAGDLHRRGGLHVDNYWHEGLSMHGSGGGSPSHSARRVPVVDDRPSHQRGPGPFDDRPSHLRTPVTGGHGSTPGGGGHCRSGYGEALIIASDVAGCAGYVGAWNIDAQGAGGDCSSVDTTEMDRVVFEPGRAWMGDTATLLHESVPVARDALRTVVRINATRWIVR